MKQHKCPNCNVKNPANAVFCSGCGMPSTNARNIDKKRKQKKWLVVAGVLLLALIIVPQFGNNAQQRQEVREQAADQEAALASRNIKITNDMNAGEVIKAMLELGGKTAEDVIYVVGTPKEQTEDLITYAKIGSNNSVVIMFDLKDGYVNKIRLNGAIDMLFITPEWFWDALDIVPQEDMVITADTGEAFRCNDPTDNIKDLWVIYDENQKVITSITAEF